MAYVYKGKLDRVVDGDTLDLEIDLGFHIKITERFRLLDIDTPEMYGVKKDSEEYKKGLISKEYVEKYLSDKELVVMTHRDSKGKFGRFLAEVFIKGEKKSINRILIDNGMAKKVEY